MYLTGTIGDLEQRVHQLPENSEDIQAFYEESLGYGEQVFLSGKWEKEFFKKGWIFGWTPEG